MAVDNGVDCVRCCIGVNHLVVAGDEPLGVVFGVALAAMYTELAGFCGWVNTDTISRIEFRSLDSRSLDDLPADLPILTVLQKTDGGCGCLPVLLHENLHIDLVRPKFIGRVYAHD